MSSKGVYRVRQLNGYEYAVVAFEVRRGNKVEYGEVSAVEYSRRKIAPPFEKLPTKQQFYAST